MIDCTRLRRPIHQIMVETGDTKEFLVLSAAMDAEQRSTPTEQPQKAF